MCLSVRHKSELYKDETAKPMITLTTPYDSPGTDVNVSSGMLNPTHSDAKKYWRNSDNTPNGGAK